MGNAPRRALVLAFFAALLAMAAAGCGGRQPPDLPPLKPFGKAQEERLHALRDRAAGVRGLPANPDAREGTISRERFRRYLEGQASSLEPEELRDLRAFTIAARMLHLIGPEDDLLEISQNAGAAAVLGLYYYRYDQLVFVSGTDIDTLGPGDELTLAHEYVHSFQDRRFDLDGRERLVARKAARGDNTEYDATIRCLIEGDATLAEVLYAQEYFGPDWQGLFDQRDQGSESLQELAEVPPAIRRYAAFPYNECFTFVASLWQDGGWASVNDVWKEPPKTTEQVLHPEKYIGRDGPRPLRVPDLSLRLGGRWAQLQDVTFGEFDVYNYLLTLLGDRARARRAAAGWGAGRMALYRKHAEGRQQVVVHLSLNWDTDRDFREYLSGQRAVIRDVSGSRVWSDQGHALRWRGDGEQGYIRWDAGQRQVDVLIALERGPLERAKAALQSMTNV
ncbi:MAG: hypothetical protein HYS09_07400 [Chloroflexi bacterium]|nr:hypothetical protein [Chloroflexota bacterium]